MSGRLYRVLARLASLTSRDIRRRELAEEFETHLELLVRSNVERGMDSETAHRQARLGFGNPAVAQELEREAWGFHTLEVLGGDLRYAVRQFAGSKGFTAVAAGTLALGIGASTLVFSLVHAVFWDPLPVSDPDRLVALSWSSPARPFAGDRYASETWDTRLAEGQRIGDFSYNAYLAVREGTTRFEDLAVHRSGLAGVLGEWGNAQIQAVSGNYFQTLGVDAVLGRTITPDDDRFGDPAPVAVISDGLWRRAFGGNEDVLDRDIDLRGTPLRIVGVIPPGLAGLDPANPRDIMISLATFNAVGVTAGAFDPDGWGLAVIGRLKNDASPEAAAAETEALVAGAIRANPPSEPYVPPAIEFGDIRKSGSLENLRERTAVPIILLLTMVGAILAIACANIAGLLLARSQARRSEIATRLALGASRGRVVGQLLGESLLLSLAGGAMGVGIAYLLNPLLPGFFGQLLGNTTLQGHLIVPSLDASPGVFVMGLSFVLMLATGCGFGLVPALVGTRMDLTTMMKPTDVAPGVRHRRVPPQKALVAAQVALAIPLVAGAGLFVRTVSNLESVPVGYDPENLLFATVASGFEDRPRLVGTLQRIEALPGVRSASMSVWPLFNNAEPRPICVPAVDPLEPEMPDLEYAFPRFFETWGVPVLEGREFLVDGETRVAVVNETFARRYYGGRIPIGETIGIRACPGTPYTIVGMVADHIDRQRVDRVPMVYLPYPTGGGLGPTTFALRTRDDPRALIPAVRGLIADAGFNPDGDVSTGTVYRERTMRQERFLEGVLVVFAALALFVASLGIYGMLAYAVRSRTREIGVRMALGAQPSRVRRMIVGESLVPVALGAVAGTGIVLGLARLVESLLFGVEARDPSTLIATLVVLTATGAVTAFLPARRASRRTLRHE